MIGICLTRYMSISHAMSAAHFSRCAFGVDLNNKNILCANVSAAIFCSVAFMEAAINEWASNQESLIDSWLKNQKVSKKIKATDLKSFDREGILNKYDISLLSKDRNKFDRGSKIIQHAEALIKLRNNLTHYKGDWLDSGTPEMLGSGSSHLTQYWPDMNLMVFKKRGVKGTWEQKEYAEWATITAINLVDNFFVELGIPSIVEHVQKDLKTRLDTLSPQCLCVTSPSS
jgi:hypothetical protein